LVEHGNVGAFAREMNNLIEQADYRQALTEAAYAWSKSFSWDKSAVDFYQLIGRSLRIPQIALEAAYAKLLLQNPPRS
jgi:hypothetical protein